MNKTFSVQTLGCKVNQYESDQIATLLVARGWAPAADPRHAALRVVNTCSVTNEAAAKSRQTARRMVRLPLLLAGSDQSTPTPHEPGHSFTPSCEACASTPPGPKTGAAVSLPLLAGIPSIDPRGCDGDGSGARHPAPDGEGRRARVILTGCWATGDREAARSLAGVDAVLTHHDDVAAELDRLLTSWRDGDDDNDNLQAPPTPPANPQSGATNTCPEPPSPKSFRDDGWIIKAGTPGGALDDVLSKASAPQNVNDVPQEMTAGAGARDSRARSVGTNALPLLGARQAERQRAFLKVQDGCDAHCTYCIIPRLRPALWSKPVADAVEEATRLVTAGHVELVLTGIFLGAYGQPTALRRRQHDGPHLGELVEALCTRVPGLRRLRLSSLEPGDLTDELLSVLRSHRQVVPHFHLPLQSGSDAILRRMNRQYGRDDFLRMTDHVRAAFDRPALTTDIIVGFPGETEAEFQRTVEVVDHARFIHVHAFPFSPRPGTAAARWTRDFVRGPAAHDRISRLTALAETYDYDFRQQFLGEEVEVLFENPSGTELDSSWRHGRSERYFSVWVEDPAGELRPGDSVRVRVSRVSPNQTFGVWATASQNVGCS